MVDDKHIQRLTERSELITKISADEEFKGLFDSNLPVHVRSIAGANDGYDIEIACKKGKDAADADVRGFSWKLSGVTGRYDLEQLGDPTGEESGDYSLLTFTYATGIGGSD